MTFMNNKTLVKIIFLQAMIAKHSVKVHLQHRQFKVIQQFLEVMEKVTITMQ
jgi:hypothetical protein